jgi:hypothetical protein
MRLSSILPRKRNGHQEATTLIPRYQSKAYKIEAVLSQWNETTDYGKSFRGLTNQEQQAEVILLNKGVAKGISRYVQKTF